MNGIHEVGGSIPPGSTTALLIAAALAASLSSAEAQPAEPCGARAAIYASGKGLRLWVRRAGELTRENPLRPLSPETLVVLDVVVNGRAATAFGPDVQNLRQGGTADSLRGDGVGPIRWRPAEEALPSPIRIVAEDGRVLFDEVRFVECGEPPKVAAPAAAAKASPRPARPAPAREEERPAVRLPQGAIP